MAKKRKQYTPFVTDSDSAVLYVHAKHCCIHPLVILSDGLTLVMFPHDRKQYLKAEEVLAWHKKELAESAGQSGSMIVMEAMTCALERFRAGKMQEV